MIKEALQYIVGMSTPTVQKIKNETYSDKQLYRINHNPKASAIKLSTLTSLIDYIRSGVDFTDEKMFIHVASPTKVLLFSGLDYDRNREHLIEVNAQVPEFPFNTYIDHENFCVNLQSKFYDTPDRALLLKFAGTVENGTVTEYGDDGITQKATIKTGIASKREALIPSPVSLMAYRTFSEARQPLSQFIFRMKQNGNGIQCALFEADGGAWRNDATTAVAAFLINNLEVYGNMYDNIKILA